MRGSIYVIAGLENLATHEDTARETMEKHHFQQISAHRLFFSKIRHFRKKKKSVEIPGSQPLQIKKHYEDIYWQTEHVGFRMICCIFHETSNRKNYLQISLLARLVGQRWYFLVERYEDSIYEGYETLENHNGCGSDFLRNPRNLRNVLRSTLLLQVL